MAGKLVSVHHYLIERRGLRDGAGTGVVYLRLGNLPLAFVMSIAGHIAQQDKIAQIMLDADCADIGVGA